MIGTPTTKISSIVVLTVLEEYQDEGNYDQPNLFQKLSLLRGVAQKMLDSAANEKPAIARPAREARDILKEMDDQTLSGLF